MHKCHRRTVEAVFGLSILFTFIDCKCGCLPTKFTISKSLIARSLDYRKQFHTSLLSPLSRLPCILRRVQLVPQRTQAVLAAPLGPLSETKGETTTIKHISDFIAALAKLHLSQNRSEE